MKIYQLLEECNLEKFNLTPELRYKVNGSFNEDEWVRATKFWLKSIEPQHRIPGKVISSAWGICEDFYKFKHLTHKQKLFLSNNLIDYWDQITCSAKAQLML